jgi:hypothetical protein
MADRRTTPIDALYSEGRHFPRGQNRDPQSRQRIECEPSFEAGNRGAFNSNVVQSPENRHDTKYDNQTSGWVRGARGEPTGHGETAEGKPNFDHSPPRSKMRR